jgi:enoyl-CoA hydratase
MFDAYKFFSFEQSQGVLTAYLDKPPANTLDNDLYAEFIRLSDEVDADSQTRAVVFATHHPKIFIAGADIKRMKEYRFEEDYVNAVIARVHETLGRLERITKPTMAAITGYALGGGCEFSLCLDFRFMSRGSARIGLPEVNIGIIPGGGGTQRLPRVVGCAKALELMMTGASLDAEEAARIGLITRACDPEKTISEAQAFAAQLAGQAPVAISLIKKCLRQSIGKSYVEGFDVEKQHCRQAVLSEDAREGITAFVEKRKPTWKGK